MAKSLRIDIMMAGDAEIKRQFEGMSKAGQDCFNSIAAEAKKVGSFKDFSPEDLTKKYKEFGIEGKKAAEQVGDALKTASRFEELVQGVDLLEAALRRAGLAGKALLLVFNPLVAVAIILATILGVALVTAAIKAAQGLAAIELDAIKLGTSFTQLTRIIEAFGKVGISPDAAISGIKQMQSQVDKFTLEKVNKAFEEAQKIMARGFGAADQIAFLQKTAEGIGPAAEAARKALETLGRPIQDNVTPLLEAMIRSAGSAAGIIPNLAGELQSMGTSGERVRLMAEALKAIAIEAGGAANAIEPLTRAIEAMPAGAERDKAVLAVLGDEFGALVVQAMRAGKSFKEAFESSKGLPEGTITNARQAALALEQLKAAAKSTFDNIPLGTLVTALDAATQKVQATANAVNAITWSGVQEGATAFNAVGTAAATTSTSVTNIGTAVSAMTGQWGSMGASGTSAVNSVNTALDELIGKLNHAVGLMQSLGSGGGGGAIPDAGGFARGGMMGGRGTGTSDSNLAWLSRGEHIMPARAVRQPGVLQLLEALRRSGGNLRSVLDRMGHFAMGGMVGLPAYAAGGTVGGGMSHVTIAFPGLAPISGLRASSAVVDELHRAAALAQVRSGGRKPSRYF